jgi:hypothetical protein
MRRKVGRERQAKLNIEKRRTSGTECRGCRKIVRGSKDIILPPVYNTIRRRWKKNKIEENRGKSSL